MGRIGRIFEGIAAEPLPLRGKYYFILPILLNNLILFFFLTGLSEIGIRRNITRGLFDPERHDCFN
jgi:hypothetical protein